MKTIKYLSTAILMVSTGLSAMEPAQGDKELKPNSIEAHWMSRELQVPDENGKLQDKQLPIAVANKIADYAGVEEEKQIRMQKRLKIKQDIKQDTAPIRVGLGVASGLIALETLSAVSQYGLSNLNILKNMAGSAVLGLMVSSLIYSMDYANYKQNQADISYAYSNPRHPYFPIPKPYERACKWKYALKYPGLYLKNGFDTTTTDFKIAFGAPFGIFGGLCALNGLSSLLK